MSKTAKNLTDLAELTDLVGDVFTYGWDVLDQPTARDQLAKGISAGYMLTAAGISGSITGGLTTIAAAETGPAAPVIGASVGFAVGEVVQDFQPLQDAADSAGYHTANTIINIVADIGDAAEAIESWWDSYFGDPENPPETPYAPEGVQIFIDEEGRPIGILAFIPPQDEGDSSSICKVGIDPVTGRQFEIEVEVQNPEGERQKVRIDEGGVDASIEAPNGDKGNVGVDIEGEQINARRETESKAGVISSEEVSGEKSGEDINVSEEKISITEKDGTIKSSTSTKVGEGQDEVVTIKSKTEEKDGTLVEAEEIVASDEGVERKKITTSGSNFDEIFGILETAITDASGYVVDETVEFFEVVGGILPESFQDALFGEDEGREKLNFFADADKLGKKLGSTVGKLIAGDDPFEQIAVNTFLGALGQAFGEALKKSHNKQNVSYLDELDNALDNFDEVLKEAFLDSATGTISSFLTAELMDQIGLDGFAGDVVNQIAIENINMIVDEIVDLFLPGETFNLTFTLDPAQIVGQIVIGEIYGAIDSVFGFDTLGENIGAQIGTIVGNFIPGIGSLFGRIIGGLIGSIFGGVPRSAADVEWDEESGEFIVTNVWARKGASPKGAEDLAGTVKDILNGVLGTIGGELVNADEVQAGTYGTRKSEFTYRDGNDVVGDPGKHTIDKTFSGEEGSADLITYGLYQAFSDFEIAGGNVLYKRAFFNQIESSTASTFDWTALTGNFQVAADYAEYLKDPAMIDALISLHPDSAFTAGWLITFQKAHELGVDVRNESDWFGGYEYFLKNHDVSAAEVVHSFYYGVRELDLYDAETGSFFETVQDTIYSAGKDVIRGTNSGEIFDLRNNQIDDVRGLTLNGRLMNDVAVSGTDFTAASGLLTFAAGETAKTVNVVIASDGDVESLERFLFKVSHINGAKPGANTAEAIIIDDGSSYLTASNIAIREDAGYAVFTVTLTNAAAEDVSVDLSLAAGSAKANGIDFGASADALEISTDGGSTWQVADSYIFTAGTTGSILVRTAIIDDGIADFTDTDDTNDEVTEYFYLVAKTDSSLVANENGKVQGKALILQNSMIINDELGNPVQTTPEPVILVNDVVVNEATGQATFTVSLSEAATETVTVNYATEDRLTHEIDIAASVYGGDGNDTIYGGDLGNDLFGEGGNDTLYGGSKDDWLFGGAGNDTLYAGDGSGSNGGDGNYLSGDGGDDELYGAEGSDWLAGGAGVDILKGGDGDDILEGGAGVGDLMSGGAGDDSYIVHLGDETDSIVEFSAAAAVTELPEQSLESYIGDIVAGTISANWIGQSAYVDDNGTVTGGEDTLVLGPEIGLQNIKLVRVDDTGKPTDLQLVLVNDDGSDNSVITLDNWFDEMQRIEWLEFADGTRVHIGDFTTFTVGTEGNDTLIGTNGDDFIYGAGGDDEIRGLLGNDYLSGGTGNDIISGDPDSDILVGGQGDDLLSGGAHDDLLSGDDGNDRLYGESGHDLLSGGRGDDILVGGEGADIFKYSRGDGQDVFMDLLTGWELMYDQQNGGWQSHFGIDSAQHIIYRDNDDNGSYGEGDEILADADGWNGEFKIGQTYDSQTQTQYTQYYYMADGAYVGADDSGHTDMIEFGLGIDIQDIQMEWQDNDLVLGINAEGQEAAIFASLSDTIRLDNWSNEKTIEQFSFLNTGILEVDDIGVWGGSAGNRPTDEDDVVKGGIDNDWLTGNGGDDELHGNAGDDILNGNAGDDHVYGGYGEDVLYGGSGTDVLDGGAGADWLIGGDGYDVASYASATSGVSVNLADSTYNAGAAEGDQYYAIEGVEGSDYDDELIGDQYGNELDGGAGDDVLNAGAGDDTYYFGRGSGQDVIEDVATTITEVINAEGEFVNGYFDASDYTPLILPFGGSAYFYYTYERIIRNSNGDEVYRMSPSGFGVILQNASFDPAGWFEGYTPTENGFQVVAREESAGDNGSDTLVLGEDISLADVMFSRSGDDLIISLRGESGDQLTIKDYVNANKTIETLEFADGQSVNLAEAIFAFADSDADGTAEADYLAGGTGENVLSGLAGDDVLSGFDGDDYLVGGAGDDILEGGAGADQLIGGDDEDTARYLTSTAGVNINLSTNEATGGDAEGDTFSSVENILASSHDDTVVGDAADNVIVGYEGDDDLSGGGGMDVLRGDEGSDTLSGDAGEDHLYGGAGTDFAYGGDDKDSIWGGDERDYLYGEDGDDLLYGEEGNDTLEGGEGADALYGGTGNDTLKGGIGDDSYLFGANDGSNTITDTDGANAIAFVEDVSSDRIWMTRSGNNLVLQVIGGTTVVTLKNFFAASQTGLLDTVTAIDGYVLYAEYVTDLVDAMTDYADANGVPESVDTLPEEITDLHSTYWHFDGNAAPMIESVELLGAPTEDIDLAGQIHAVDHNDTDLTYSISADPGNGTIESIDANTGAFTYRPADNYHGSERFTVRVTDPDGNYREEVVTFDIASVNDAPDDLFVIEGDLTVPEITEGAVVATFDAHDVDAPDEGDFDDFIFEVNDPRFEFVGGQLKLKANNTLDYNEEQTVTVRITVTDQNGEGLSYFEDFDIQVEDVNEAPFDIQLSNLTVSEDTQSATIGNIDVSDYDEPGTAFTTHNYLIEEGVLDAGASARFEIVDGQLKLKDGVSINHEDEQQIILFVTAWDDAGSVNRSFEILVDDINEAPYDLTLANTVDIVENNFHDTEDRQQQEIADVAVLDLDLVGSEFGYGQHTVAVLNDERFYVSNGKLYLRAGAEINYEQETSIALTLQATDGGDLSGDPVEFILSVSDQDDVWVLTQGDDSGVNAFVGEQGVDIVQGLNGSDEIHGGAGNDILYGGDQALSFDADGNDYIYGDDGQDTIYGGSNDDHLFGGADNDTIYGGSGADLIYGDAGSDTYDGEVGTDTVDYSSAASSVRVNISQSTANYSSPTEVIPPESFILAIGGHDGDAEGDSYTSIEQIVGSEFGDVIVGSDIILDGQSNVIHDGKNELVGLGGNDIIIGGEGADNLYGGAGDDYLDGQAGNDILDGWTGDDKLIGGFNDDTYLAFRISGNDTVYNSDFDSQDDKVTFRAFTFEDYLNQLSAAEKSAKTELELRAQFTALYSAADLEEIHHTDLWFEQDGEDLVVSVIGTTSSVRINSWFSLTEGQENFRVNVIKTGFGPQTNEIDVQSLVDIMAGETMPVDRDDMDTFIAANQTVFDAAWVNNAVPVVELLGSFDGYGENSDTGSADRKFHVRVTDNDTIDVNNFSFVSDVLDVQDIHVTKLNTTDFEIHIDKDSNYSGDVSLRIIVNDSVFEGELEVNFSITPEADPATISINNGLPVIGNEGTVIEPNIAVTLADLDEDISDVVISGDLNGGSFVHKETGDPLTYIQDAEGYHFAKDDIPNLGILAATGSGVDLNLSVRAETTDGNDTAGSGWYDFTVEVNGRPTALSFTGSVTENQGEEIALGTVGVTDPDGETSFKFAILDENSPFTIDADSGDIYVNDISRIDYAQASSHNVHVRVTDLNGQGLDYDDYIVIDVIDLNENPELDNVSFDIPEDATTGSLVGTVVADDPDTGLNASLTYLITAGNESGLFAIDNAGNITTTGALDHESPGVPYQLTVEVRDRNGGADYLSDTAVVTVNVGDVNEAPVLPNKTIYVDEDYISTTPIFQYSSLGQLDEDDGVWGALTYQVISGNDYDELFNIDASGRVKVIDGLDYETDQQFTFTIRATDGGSLYDEATLTININDVNEYATHLFDWNGAVNYALESVAADHTRSGLTGGANNDPIALKVGSNDPEGNVTFSLTNDAGGRFQINATTGDVTVKDASKLDYDNGSGMQEDMHGKYYLITAKGADTLSPAHYKTKDFKIYVQDVDEYNPDIVGSALNSAAAGNKLQENNPNHNWSLDVSQFVNDDDGETLSYSIIAGANNFQIDSESGEVTYIGADPDYETGASYGFTVKVRDTSTGAVDTAAVTVPVADGNDDPVIDLYGSTSIDHVLFLTYPLVPFADYFVFSATDNETDKQNLTFSIRTRINNGVWKDVDSQNIGFMDASAWGHDFRLTILNAHFAGRDFDTMRTVSYQAELTVHDGDGGSASVTRSGFAHTWLNGQPIIIDLENDGFDLVTPYESTIQFDMDGDGAADITGWVGETDALLALDRNDDGAIDNGSEISFVQDYEGAETDLQGLVYYDLEENGGNGNGLLDIGDAHYGKFLVWQDKNQNGRSDDDELWSLEEEGIVAISLTRTPTGDDPDTNGNHISATAEYLRADGTTVGTVGDLRLSYVSLGADAGIAVDDAVETQLDTAVILDYLANDLISDPDNVYLQYMDDPLHGIIDIAVDGTVTYTPDDGFIGTDVITYRIVDLVQGSSEATIYVTIGNEVMGDDGANEFDLSSFTDSVGIYGLGGNDTLIGGSAADSIDGGTGDDYLQGGLGADTIDGGDGIDSVSYGDSAEAVNINLENGVLTGGTAAGDVLANVEKIFGSTFDDIMTGSTAADYLSGGLGADTLSGGAGDDSLFGGTGDDLLEGGAGADNLTGGTGSDTASYAASDAAVSVNLAADTATGGHAEGDVIAMSVENLTGSDYADSLTGDSQDNILTGGAGDDALDGGTGYDTAVFSGNFADYTLTDNGGSLTVEDTVSSRDGTDTLSGVERLRFADRDVTFRAAADQYSVDIDTPTTLDALANDDLDGLTYIVDSFTQPANGTVTLNNGMFDFTPDTGFEGQDSFTYTVKVGDNEYTTTTVSLNVADVISGGSSGDTLTGTEFADVFDGKGGVDNISGLGGDDIFLSYGTGTGSGNTYDGGDGFDIVQGGDGDDLIRARLIDIERIDGGAGYNELGTAFYYDSDETLDLRGIEVVNIDILVGAHYIDRIYGTEGDDLIDGKTGRDYLYGEGGDDTFIVSGLDYGFDSYHGGDGFDTIQGDDGDTLIQMYGMSGIERIDGGDGYNIISTTGFNSYETLDLRGIEILNIDKIEGRHYRDTIYGTAADDIIDGMQHNDTLYGESGDDTFLYTNGDGTDAYYGGAGYDTLRASAGDDDIYVSMLDSIERIDGEDGYNRLVIDYSGTFNAGNYLLLNIQEIHGNSSSQTIIGNTVDNILNAGTGDDIIDGGAGADIAVFSGNFADYTVTDNQDGTFTVSGADGTDTLTNVEVLRFDDRDYVLGVVNNDPVITSSVAVNVDENGTAVSTVTATDGDNDTLSYSITNGADSALFSIDSATGALSFLAAPDYETPADSDLDGIYEVEVTVDDGNGGTASQLVSVTVDNVNEAPVATNIDLGSMDENGSLLITAAQLLAGVTDEDGDTPFVTSVTVDPAYGSITDNGDDTWTFTPVTDYVGNDVPISFTVSDGSLTDTETALVDVLAVNAAPVITSSATVNVDENGTAVTIVTATDGDNDTLSYSITNGADSALFSIDSTTGALSFLAAPDYETPADSDLDGIYEVEVTVDDGNGGSASQLVSVTVDNVNEAPVATNIDLGSMDENGSLLITAAQLLAGVTDEDGDTPFVTSVTVDPAYGTITNNGDDTWTFTPVTDYVGDDVPINFTVKDLAFVGLTDTATAFVDVVSAGYNYIYGTSGDDVITGTSGNDWITTLAGADTVSAGAGDDYVEAGNHQDSFDGGAGVDTIDYSYSTSSWSIDLVAGTATLLNSYTETLVGFESVISGSGNDTISGTDGNNILTGGDGNDYYYGLDGDDIFYETDNYFGNYFDGGAGYDILRGDTGDNLFYTRDFTSMEEVDGVGGYNILILSGSDTDHILDLRGVVLNHIDEIQGTDSTNDTIYGNDDANYFVSGTGADTIYGEGGDDTFIAAAGIKNFYGGTGVDTADYSYTTADGTFNLVTGVGDIGGTTKNNYDIENLITGSGADTITGSDANNILTANAGDDVMDAGLGDDTYVITRDDGSDTINNLDAASTNDTLSFEDSITYNQLWFTQSGDDLVIDDLGSDSQVTVADWFANSDNGDYHVENIQTANMILDHTEVNQLIQAMAAMTMPTGGEIDLEDPNNASLASVIAATWESRT